MKFGSDLNYHAKLFAAKQESAFDKERLPPSVAGLEHVVLAFQELSKRRRAVSRGGMGGVEIEIDRISIESVEAYCRLNRITDADEIEELLYLIGEMDDEFCDFQYAKMKKPSRPPTI